MTENEIKRVDEVLWTKWSNTSDSEEDRELHIALDLAMKIIKEYRQYRAIGTVEEFKTLKIKEHNYDNCHNYTCRKKCEKDGYNKAIDEFVEEALKQFTEFDLKDGYPTVGGCKGILKEIAEQMKEGV